MATDSADQPQKLSEMTQNDFPTSPPATGGDAELAADLVTNAALAATTNDRVARTTVDEHARCALDHPHADIRVSAVAALARIGTFTASDLCALLNDNSSMVRRRAVEAAAVMVQSGHGDAAVVDQLLRALTDDASVAEVAAFAIGEFGPDCR